MPNNANKNRGAHGDSSLILGGLPSLSENPPALAVGSVKAQVTGSEVILDFIGYFSEATDTFMNGCCFWFATILSIRFGGETLYSPVENHFVQKIEERLYDVRGDVTVLYDGRSLYQWVGYENVDSLDWGRVYRDCVVKTT